MFSLARKERPACLTGFAPFAVAALLNDLAALVSRRAARQRDLRWSSISKDAAAQAVAAADAEAAAADDQNGDAEANGGDVEKQKVCWCEMQHVPACGRFVSGSLREDELLMSS